MGAAEAAAPASGTGASGTSLLPWLKKLSMQAGFLSGAYSSDWWKSFGFFVFFYVFAASLVVYGIINAIVQAGYALYALITYVIALLMAA